MKDAWEMESDVRTRYPYLFDSLGTTICLKCGERNNQIGRFEFYSPITLFETFIDLFGAL